MEAHIDLQNSVQSSPQGQAQASPFPDIPSPAPPTTSEAAEAPHPPPASDTTDAAIAKAEKKKRNEELCALSQTFGDIPGIPIFTVWDKRQECSKAAVHRSIMAGICGNRRDGAFSVALSSLYKDDEDGGDVIIYTGAGGREKWTNTSPPKRVRLGPQTKDQSWDHPSNKALLVSSCTENPVRVIRSWRCPSQYAPLQGYRYDGLYKVAACWSTKGRNGKNICRCRLERLPDQLPIPVRPVTLSTRRQREHFVSSHTYGPVPSTNWSDPCDIPNETPNQPNSSTSQLTGSIGIEPMESPNPPQQRAMENGSNLGEVDLNAKEDSQLPLSPKRRATPNQVALPRYRWDSKKKQLVRVPTSHPNPEDIGTAEGDEEEYRGEDDTLTLVPSEDSHADVAVEDAETEYYSDRDSSPRFETPDESRPGDL